jgi:hypothetical protein
MNDALMLLRNRLRDLIRTWIELEGGDSLERLAGLYLSDPNRAFEPSAQDRLVMRSARETLRRELADLSAKTELASLWRDIIRELFLEELRPLSSNTKNHQTKPRMKAEVSPLPEPKPEPKPVVAIVVAMIGLIASVLSSIIASRATAHDTAKTTAQSTANAAIQAFQERVSGGTIDADMNQKDQVGRDFTVNKQGLGLFRIQFKPPFAGSTVVAVAAPHKDKIPTLARIETHDGGSILVGIHQVSDDALVDAPFSFYVLEAVPIKP